jgi:micrococcal nuclease
MNKILTAIVLSALTLTSFAAEMVLPIRGVADGDTIKTTLKLPCPLCNVSVRVLGIDTPESTHLAKCPAEKARGLAAKEFVTNLAQGQETMIIKSFKWDKYGGRIDAYVEINGVNVGEKLIANGFAKPYTGEGPKPDWCN